MKIHVAIRLAVFATTTFAFPAFSQGVMLSTGDTWSFSFSSLDYVSSQPGPMGIFYAEFDFSATPISQPHSVQPQLSFQLFDGPSSDDLIATGSYPIGGNPPMFIASPGWQDLAGSVSFSVASGSFLLNSLTFTAFVPDQTIPGSYDTFQGNFTPTSAPEPTAFSLIVIGGGFGLLRTFFRYKQPWHNLS